MRRGQFANIISSVASSIPQSPAPYNPTVFYQSKCHLLHSMLGFFGSWLLQGYAFFISSLALLLYFADEQESESAIRILD